LLDEAFAAPMSKKPYDWVMEAAPVTVAPPVGLGLMVQYVYCVGPVVVTGGVDDQPL
jgi:hypothetical protein